MAFVVEMPKLTDTMEEGVLVRWQKREGEAVEPGDVLGEVETDKATMEFEAYDRGVLLKHLISEGQAVPPGAPIAIIGKAGEDIAPVLAKLGSRDGGGAAAFAAAAPAKEPAAAAPPAAPAGGRVLASPLARRMAREAGIDLGGVTGSGPGGRIVKRDVEQAAAHPETTAAEARRVELPEPLIQDAKVLPLSMMRKTIARRLTESKSGIPHYYVTMEIAADPIVEFRSRTNADAKDVKLTFNDILIKACAKALRIVPEVNASWSDQGIVMHNRVDIGVAVAMEEGLITPVVRNADRKSLSEIAAEVADLIERARARKLKPDEYRNGTFSISNLGMFGISHFAAVINPPEAAILAVGAVQRKPVVHGDALVVGHVLAVTLSCDHRVIDGAVSARFLAALKELLEHPMRLVL
jgi:pyruvate dehydrogenase E2 component (dihydrolipoamide acetyltransferase)